MYSSSKKKCFLKETKCQNSVHTFDDQDIRRSLTNDGDRHQIESVSSPFEPTRTWKLKQKHTQISHRCTIHNDIETIRSIASIVEFRFFIRNINPHTLFRYMLCLLYKIIMKKDQNESNRVQTIQFGNVVASLTMRHGWAERNEHNLKGSSSLYRPHVHNASHFIPVIFTLRMGRNYELKLETMNLNYDLCFFNGFSEFKNEE